MWQVIVALLPISTRFLLIPDSRSPGCKESKPQRTTPGGASPDQSSRHHHAAAMVARSGGRRCRGMAQRFDWLAQSGGVLCHPPEVAHSAHRQSPRGKGCPGQRVFSSAASPVAATAVANKVRLLRGRNKAMANDGVWASPQPHCGRSALADSLVRQADPAPNMSPPGPSPAAGF